MFLLILPAKTKQESLSSPFLLAIIDFRISIVPLRPSSPPKCKYNFSTGDTPNSSLTDFTFEKSTEGTGSGRLRNLLVEYSVLNVLALSSSLTYGSFCRIECAPIPYKHRHSERFKVLSCKIELFNSSIGHFAG